MDNTIDITNDTRIVNDIGAVVFVLGNNRINLTRQVLYDSSFQNEEHTFFYDILTMNPDSFNVKYSRHAYFQNIKYGTANILLNVSCGAFGFIVDCLLWGNDTCEERLARINPDNIKSLLDLATIFGMDHLVKYITSTIELTNASCNIPTS